MKRIGVFAGSSAQAPAAHLAAARALGREIASRRLELVYGGGRLGVMGALADSALRAGGHVIGVIPDFMFERELAHPDVTDLHVVSSMGERKVLMAELVDAAVALPGGFGTLDELFDALTGAQLGLHRKPCGLLNVQGYFDSLLRFLDEATASRLIKKDDRALLHVHRRPGPLLDRLADLAARARRVRFGEAPSSKPDLGRKITVYDRVYDLVRRVPRGRVATYGEIAALAGLPNPRQVGYALHALRNDDVPWHRILNARGEVSGRSEPGCEEEQRSLLEAEGVRFDDRGRVSLARFGWSLARRGGPARSPERAASPRSGRERGGKRGR